MEKIRQKAKGKGEKAKGGGGDSVFCGLRNTRYAAGLMAGVGAGLAGYALFWEPSDVRLEHVTLRVPRSAGVLPEKGLRILHLSDFHFQGSDWREQPKMRKVRRLTQGLEYDLLIHTGDFLHTDGGMANVFELLDALPKPRLGAYAVMGNHDYVCYDMRDVIVYSWRNFLRWEDAHRQRPFVLTPKNRWEKAKQVAHFSHFLMNYPVEAKRTGWNDVANLTDELARRGIQVLHNQSVRLTTHHPAIGEVDLHIAGIDDLHEGAPDLDSVLAGIPPEELTLLLSHNPDILDHPDVHQADVVLAGHTHGGQIVLPFLGAAHTHSEHLGRREASGPMQRANTQVYVNRGLGEGIPVRFGAPPVVAVVTLMNG